jgi:aerobic-type carbon monoxide dehydrogenase small subunit (CoxS/CutS family)
MNTRYSHYEVSVIGGGLAGLTPVKVDDGQLQKNIKSGGFVKPRLDVFERFECQLKNVGTNWRSFSVGIREVREANMNKYSIIVNGERFTLEVPHDMPLLWVLRDELNFTGTKYGCGEGSCGACTVLQDGKAIRSCLVPISAAQGKEILTIEGLSADGSHPLQRSWIEVGVSECGYCQPGQIMTAVSLLSENPNPNDAEIVRVMSGNLCRCGTYNRIRQAVQLAAQEMS